VLNGRAPLIIVVLSLVALPFVLDLVGLPLRSSIDVVAFAVACMGLNILVGNTGLVSFGHGAWFGLGAYAAALSQRYWFPGSVILPTLFAIAFVAVSAVLSGALILRRRGVYFSLLTLALTALCHWLPLDRVHWRRKRTRRRHARNGIGRRS
jgi:ABC-type branched-subunit amino acid transport system permease subunit